MGRKEWKLPFKTLKDKIKPLEEAGLCLYHANMMTPFHDRDQVEEFTSFLEPAQMADDLVGVIEAPTASSRHHAHYFYGDRKAFSHLERELSGLHTWIADIPSELLPDFDLPSINSQTSKNIVLWSNLVYMLAWEYKRWYLSADVEYQMKLNRIDFRPWEELIQPPGIDPLAVLTHQKTGGIDFGAWTRRFQEASCTVPEYFGAYLRDAGSNLCGDFLRASLATIDLIFATSAELQITPDINAVWKRNAVSDKRKASRTTRSSKPKRKELSPDEELLHSYLMALHQCESGQYCFVPFKNQGEVAKELSRKGSHWDQVRVSRTLKSLFSRAVTEYDHLKPQKRYEMLCDQQLICGTLMKIRFKSMGLRAQPAGRGFNLEFCRDNLDRFAAKSSDEEE